MNLQGENWNECPLPFSNATASFCSRKPFICTVHPYFIPTGMTGEHRGEREDFLFLGFIENHSLVLLHDRTNSATRQSRRNHRECSHFSEHIRFPSLPCYFWASPNRADESSYELTPSELLKCEKIFGDTSARCLIQYFVLLCLGVLRLLQNPLLSASLHTGEK